MNSEVARLREQYALEYEAGKRALEDPAIIAPHPYITRRMELMWEQMQRIEQAVGREAAKNIFLSEHPEQSKPNV
jgi:hypothetical protein